MPTETKPRAARAVKVAPAKPAAPAVLKDFAVSTRRAPLYTFSKGAPRADCPAVSDSAYVSRGARTSDGAPFLVLTDGSKASALPLSVIGAAISSGVITRAEITALLG